MEDGQGQLEPRLSESNEEDVEEDIEPRTCTLSTKADAHGVRVLETGFANGGVSAGCIVVERHKDGHALEACRIVACAASDEETDVGIGIHVGPARIRLGVGGGVRGQRRELGLVAGADGHDEAGLERS